MTRRSTPSDAFRRQVRRPVRRASAQTNLMLMLLSFAGSVFLTRGFLTLTGYPQLGGGGLHVAHVLWVGLLLFVAALLPLIWANRWVYRTGALLAGAGVGLFIDEVGKFITASNDYFFPAAAPIVYAFFLVSVLVYLRVARPREADARTELYAAFGEMEEILDGDLSRPERSALAARLRRAEVKASRADLARLARDLRAFVSRRRQPSPVPRGSWGDALRRFARWERRLFPRARLQAVLVGGLLGLAVLEFKNPAETLLGEQLPGLFGSFTGRHFGIEAAPRLFALRVSLEIAIGLALFLGAVLLILRREKAGLAVGTLALLLSLTVVNLVVMYFEQFSTLVTAAMQLTVLLGILRYRRRFPS